MSHASETARGAATLQEADEEDLGALAIPLGSFVGEKMQSMLLPKADSEDGKRTVKSQIARQFWSVVARVAKGDGVLGEKEAAYIRRTFVGQWGEEAERDAFEKGYLDGEIEIKDIEIISDAGQQVDTFAKNYEVRNWVSWVLYYAIVASCQDGLDHMEVEEAFKVGREFGVKDEDVQSVIHVVSMEYKLLQKATHVLTALSGKQ